MGSSSAGPPRPGSGGSRGCSRAPGPPRPRCGSAQRRQVRGHVGRRCRLEPCPARARASAVGRQVAPVRRERPRRAPALHLQPREVLLGGAGQRRLTGSRPGAARPGPGQEEPEHRRLVLQRPVGHQRRRGRPGAIVSTVMKPSSTPSGRLAHGVRPGGQEDRGVLVADAGRVPGADQQLPVRRLEARPPRPARVGPSSSGGSPATSRVPAGISSTMRVDRGPVLAHQRHRAVVVHGHDGHRAGMADDEALERAAVGVEQVEPVHPEQPGPQELLLRDAAEARARASR